MATSRLSRASAAALYPVYTPRSWKLNQIPNIVIDRRPKNEHVRLSLIVVARDADTIIDSLLDDLRNQVLETWNELELIVVVDPSTTDRTVERFAAQLPTLETENYCLLIGSAPGLAAGWNDAISTARAEWVLRLDAHGLYPSHYLKETLISLEGSDLRTVVGGAVLSARAISAWPTSAVLDGSYLFSGGASRAKRAVERPTTTTFVARGAFPLSLYEEVGLYRILPFACEDTEWASRARRKGVSFRLTPKQVSYHRSRPTGATFCRQKFRNGAAATHAYITLGESLGKAKLMVIVIMTATGIACALRPRRFLPGLASLYCGFGFQLARRDGAADPFSLATWAVAGHVAYYFGSVSGVAKATRDLIKDNRCLR